VHLPVRWAQVLRAYDTRFEHSDSRPDLYEEPGLAPGTEVVCRIGDKNLGAAAAATAAADTASGVEATAAGTAVATAPAAAEQPAAPRADEDGAAGPRRRLDLKLRDRRRKVYDEYLRVQWLWDFAGEVLVIATPFREGRHYATSPKDFVPVVRFLQRMHRLGCVHGDVRCANIVFGGREEEASASASAPAAPSGLLIDLDMGGRLVDNPAYPDGYQGSLPDGSRLGIPGRLIKPKDDWYAMHEVIFRVHWIRPRKPPPPPEGGDDNGGGGEALQPSMARYYEQLFEQDKFRRHFRYGEELDDADAFADELVEYLERAETERYEVGYSHHLAELVREQWSSS
jgi:hypothetical protein